jgi:hypothetical protein
VEPLFFLLRSVTDAGEVGVELGILVEGSAVSGWEVGVMEAYKLAHQRPAGEVALQEHD